MPPGQAPGNSNVGHLCKSASHKLARIGYTDSARPFPGGAREHGHKTASPSAYPPPYHETLG
eukprot:5281330-Lingulodinium_polyedra.AAC.1